MFYTCAPASAVPARHPHKSTARRVRGLTVDIHCHVISKKAEALVAPHFAVEKEPSLHFAAPSSREVNRKMMVDIEAQITQAERRLVDMDRMGIDIQAISTGPPQFYYWTQPELGRETARIVNDNLADIVGRHPDRFVAMGTVPLQHTEYAIAEMRRCVGSLGMRGIELGTNVNGEELAQPRLEPFFAAAEELGILLFLHPSGFTEGRRLAKHYFNNVIGNPLDSTVALGHLIFEGVLDRHPGLKVCIAHGGGYVPPYAGRMDHAFAARADCREKLKRKPSDVIKTLYFDTMVFEPDQLEFLVRKYGSDHILLGTDYPYDMGESDPVGLVNRTPKLTAEDRARICGLNAARLLRIEVSQPAAATPPARRKPAAAPKKPAAARKRPAPMRKVAATRKRRRA
jgi:aminocarboxymuconate-semialdehyde decarboxylase